MSYHFQLPTGGVGLTAIYRHGKALAVSRRTSHFHPMSFEPKKTTSIYTRVPEAFKADFKRCLATLGITESFFVRVASEALVELVKSKRDLALPVRLMDVESKQMLDRAKTNQPNPIPPP